MTRKGWWTIAIILLALSIILEPFTLFSEKIAGSHHPKVVATHQEMEKAKKQQSIFSESKYNKNLSRLFYKISINVDENGEDATFKMQFTYQNTGFENISFIIHQIDIITILSNHRLSSVVVYDSKGALFYQWKIFPSYHLINISLREPLQPFGFYSLTIEFLLENTIIYQEELNRLYIMEWSITHDEDVEQFSITFTLPTQYLLYNQTAIEPKPNYQSSDNRRLEWNFNNIKKDDVQTWLIRFQAFNSEENVQNFNHKLWWAFLVLVFICGGIAGSLSMYFYLKTRTDVEKKEIVETLLSEPEKEILEIIKNEGAAINQSKICSISGFSKAKVSYYLTQLEEKGVILRERWGRMNRIRIIDESFE